MKKSSIAQLFAIDRFMTPSPYVVEPDETLAQAYRKMRDHGIRHLPVLEGDGESGKLVGVLSERDLLMLEAIREVDPDRVPVRAAMQTDVFGVDRGTPLDEVVQAMASHKYGCVVVWSGRAVVGIFTSTDALYALADLERHGKK